MALRRLIYQLADIGLPVDPYWRRDGGLAFDLLSSYSTGEKILIGHADGVITIDLVESLDAYRESLRVRLGEPYRTMLGHFRHEAGHYYQNILVETGTGAQTYLDRCRELFGDERASYSDALDRHYSSAHRRAGRTPTSPSTPRCIPGRTSPSASRTTCISPTRWTPPARRAWFCTPTGCGSPVRATSPAGVLLLRPDRATALRLAVDLVVLQSGEHGDGQNPLYPFDITRRSRTSSGSCTPWCVMRRAAVSRSSVADTRHRRCRLWEDASMSRPNTS